MKTFEWICALGILIFSLLNQTCPINAFPADPDQITIKPENNRDDVLENQEINGDSTIINTPVLSSNETSTDDLETSGSEQNEEIAPTSSVNTIETPDNIDAASNVDPTVYGGGIYSPEAFQQYISQYGAAYPYTAAPYPAPIYPGFVQPPPPPPMYPNPYVVETGYDGYLIPTTATATKSTPSSDTKTPSSTALMSPLMILSNIISTIMMSTLFRILATVASAVGMIFFSGTIMNIFCTYTPICDMSNKAVTYIKRQNTTEKMGRMISEEMTPERIRRAAEFVRNAVDKYHELQKFMGHITNDKSKEF